MTNVPLSGRCKPAFDLDDSATEPTPDGLCCQSGDVHLSRAERRAAQTLRKNHAYIVENSPYAEVHISRKHAAALLALLDRLEEA